MRNRISPFIWSLLAAAPLWLPIGAMAQGVSSNHEALISLSPPKARMDAPLPGPAWEDYAGAEACAECHPKQYRMWQGSTHAKAGGPPTAQRIIPTFEGALHFRDAEVQLENHGTDDYAFVVKTADGDKHRYQVDAVIGGGYIPGGGTQTYFTKLPDGTLRYLAFDYSVTAQAWFCQTNDGGLFIDEKLSIHQCLSWPPKLVLGRHVNFDRGCLDCHGSQIQLSYAREAGRYRTRFKSLHINCEACHGPGRRHVALARAGKLKQGGDTGMRDLASLDTRAGVEVCLQCHAEKTPIEHGGHPTGGGFRDRYAIFTTLSHKSGSLLPTGRVRDSSYQENHEFSACYRRGTLTCTNCHSPHEQGYRDALGRHLEDPLDDRQCTVCHAKEGNNAAKHSHHPAKSAGNHCVACHMPALQSPGVGDHVPYVRTDHSISIPRPGLEARMGTTNACAQCHPFQTPEKLEAIMDRWYGQLRPLPRPIEVQLEALSGGVRAEALLSAEEYQPAAQVTNLSLFIERFLQPDMDTIPDKWISALKALSTNSDPDIKAAALMALHLSQGDQPAMRAFLRQQLDSLGTEEAAIRRRWAYDLNGVGDTYRLKGDRKSAWQSYVKVLEIAPNHARILTNLGGIKGEQGHFDEAVSLFKQAIAANPDYAPAYFNLGIALSRQGHDKEAREAFHQAMLRQKKLAPPRGLE